jgi:hypothetical protein
MNSYAGPTLIRKKRSHFGTRYCKNSPPPQKKRKRSMGIRRVDLQAKPETGS